jgi:hypothetical protein
VVSNRGIRALLFLVIAGVGLYAGQATVQARGELFPMQTGTRWIYQGEVAWQPAAQGSKAQTKQMQWEMKVVDSVERGRYKVALIVGHPADLAWYDEGREGGCHILIASDNEKFYLSRCSPGASQERLSLPGGDLAELVHDEDLIFKLPLHQGEVFGAEPDRGEREDTFYEWSVEEVRPAALHRIAGISFDRPQPEYVIIYRTMPDHQIATYVPGIGLTAYVYSHHGTVSEVDMKLVKFEPPGRK